MIRAKMPFSIHRKPLRLINIIPLKAERRDTLRGHGMSDGTISFGTELLIATALENFFYHVVGELSGFTGMFETVAQGLTWQAIRPFWQRRQRQAEPRRSFYRCKLQLVEIRNVVSCNDNKSSQP